MVRDLLDKDLKSGGFSGYAELAEKYKRFGKGFTKSSIHRYGEKLRARMLRAQAEAEILATLGDTVGWLVKWAQSYPKEAERLVKRLKTKQQ